MDLHAVVAPDVPVLELSRRRGHQLGERLPAVEPEIEKLVVAAHLDEGLHFGGAPLDGEQCDPGDARPSELFPGFEGDHGGNPLFHGPAVAEVTAAALGGGGPHGPLPEPDAFEGLFVSGSGLFGLREKPFDPVDLSGGKDLRPEFQFRGGIGDGAVGGFHLVPADVADPMSFQYPRNLLHEGRALAEEDGKILVEQRLDVGVVIPHDLGKDVEIEVAEKPVVRGGVEHGPEAVREHPPVVGADGFRRVIGDERQLLHGALGGVVPHVDLAVPHGFDPTCDELVVLLLLGAALQPGARGRHLDEDVFGHLLLGREAVEIIGHHGDEAGHALTLQPLGNGEQSGPEEIRRLFAVPAPGGKSLEIRGALRAPAAGHGVVGHQVEEVAVVMDPAAGAVAEDHAAAGGGLPREDRFGVLKNLLHDAGAEAEVSRSIAGDPDGRAVTAAAVGLEGEVLRMAFRKTLNVSQPGQPVTVGQGQSGKAEVLFMERQHFAPPGFGRRIVPAGFRAPGGGPVDDPEKGVRPVEDRDPRQRPLPFHGDHGPEGAGEVEAKIGETLQEFVTAEARPVARTGQDGIAPGDEDLPSSRFDDETVPVQRPEIDFEFRGKRAVADAETRAGKSRRDPAFRRDPRPAGDLAQKLSEIGSGVPDGSGRFGRHIDAEEGLPLPDEGQFGFGGNADAPGRNGGDRKGRARPGGEAAQEQQTHPGGPKCGAFHFTGPFTFRLPGSPRGRSTPAP